MHDVMPIPMPLRYTTRVHVLSCSCRHHVWQQQFRSRQHVAMSAPNMRRACCVLTIGGMCFLHVVKYL